MSEFAPLALILPFPPTVNKLWRSVRRRQTSRGERARAILSDEARAFYESAKWEIAAQLAKMPKREIIESPVAVEITLYPPDNRRRDLDNYIKATLDAITKSGCVWKDDALARELRAAWGEASKPSICQVFIKPFKNGDVK